MAILFVCGCCLEIMDRWRNWSTFLYIFNYIRSWENAFTSHIDFLRLPNHNLTSTPRLPLFSLKKHNKKQRLNLKPFKNFPIIILLVWNYCASLFIPLHKFSLSSCLFLPFFLPKLIQFRDNLQFILFLLFCILNRKKFVLNYAKFYEL